MKTPVRITILRAAAALPLFAILIFGWGPIPGFAMVGAAVAMLSYYTLGVVGMLAHLRSGRSPIHLTLSGFRLRWDLFSRILKVASLSSMQILVNHVALIAITAYVARFGVEALAGYGLASRLELLISSLVLAFGVGTTTMVAACVGAGLLERARRVTLVACALAASLLTTIGLGVAVSGRLIAGLFTYAEKVVSAASDYFHVGGGLRVHGRIGSAAFCLSRVGLRHHSLGGEPVEGRYRVDWRMFVAATASRSARLVVLSCRWFHGYRSANAGRLLYFPTAKSTQWSAFRLKRRPALITEGLHTLQCSLEFDCRASTKDE